VLRFRRTRQNKHFRGQNDSGRQEKRGGYELIVNFSRGKNRKKRKTAKEPDGTPDRIINLVVDAGGDTKP
jgi:hypothetical protein